MTVTPNGQDRQGANLAQQRKRTLLGLLKAEPETLHGLIRCTGWGEHHTHMALLQLCADGLVRRCGCGRGNIGHSEIVCPG